MFDSVVWDGCFVGFVGGILIGVLCWVYWLLIILLVTDFVV